jgi:peptide chain release factor 2
MHKKFLNILNNLKNKRKKELSLINSEDLWNSQIFKLQNQIKELENYYNNILNLDEMLHTELKEDAFSELTNLCAELEIYFMKIFNEEENNWCFFEIRSGTGGLDAQDWAQILFKMYLKYFEKNKISYEVLEYNVSEEAGIKNALIRVNKNYNLILGEMGTHRLVRISPFNALGKRQTSFASVYIYKEVDNNIKINIDENDLKIQTFRASGAGGQHVNKTESAIRIIHVPSGIVTSCQTQRSQYQNKEYAMKALKAKLLHMKLQEIQKESKIADRIKSTWSTSFRSYVLDPYKQIKDDRLDICIAAHSQVENILNGELDIFINEYFYKYTLNEI